MKDDVKKVANYLLTFYNQEKEYTILDPNDEALDIAIGMNNLRFQKLMYFAYGFYYSATKEELFESQFKAYRYGPIINSLFQINVQATNNDGYKNIPPETYQEFDYHDLPIDFEILDEILIKLERFSTWSLVQMSHAPYSPWSKAKQSQKINQNWIKKYFSNLKLR